MARKGKIAPDMYIYMYINGRHFCQYIDIADIEMKLELRRSRVRVDYRVLDYVNLNFRSCFIQ